jgi:hypothetical protein
MISMLPANARSRGVVMVVVLFILAILGVLLLEVSRSGKEELVRASMLLERTEARLQTRTHETELILSLLTNPLLEASESGQTENPYAKAWRFDGKPFTVGDATIRIQDISGQLGMPQPGFSAKLPLVESLLVQIGVDATRAAATTEFLRDVQSGPDGAPLQDLSELIGPGRLTIDEVDRLRWVATLYPTSSFNPATAPPEVLSVLYSGPPLDGLLALRREGQLSPASFEKVVSDFDPEFIRFSPGRAFTVEISVDRSSVRHGTQGVLEVDAYASEPVTWWARFGLSAASGAREPVAEPP